MKTESSCDGDDEGDIRPFFWFPTFGGKSTEDIMSVGYVVLFNGICLWLFTYDARVIGYFAIITL